MPKLSAGILLYRHGKKGIEVFLVHPGGPFWASKDKGAWSVPKGEYAQGEDALAAAKREFAEETGVKAPAGNYAPMGEVKYGNKQLTMWAIEGDAPAGEVESNYFELEWPPRTGKIQRFPEVDRTAWFNLATAEAKLVRGQVPLIQTLASTLSSDQLSLL